MKFTATGPTGIRAVWYSLGATLAELHVPDARGDFADVVLGFDTEEGYRSPDNQHFGCTTGRYANRIAGGKFTLDGTSYQLALNNVPNHLHGGPTRNLAKVDWQGESLADPAPGVRFRYTSPDGEEGYPGNLDVTVEYALTWDGGVRIEYTATTDRPTIINLTNHSYFNLSGHGSGSILDHEVKIHADEYTPKDATGIPLGNLAPVAGTPFDFREFHEIGERVSQLTGADADGYDHNFVLRGGGAGDPRLVAEAFDPKSGRRLKVHSDQPGVQLYGGNYLWGATCKGGKVYGKNTAFCFETQHFPDSPNQPKFPSTVLRPGEAYRQVCVYEFSAE